MAFQLNALDPSNSGSGGASLLGTYRTADAFADTLVSGYFNEGAGNLRWTHALLVRASDKTGILLVNSDGANVVVTEFGGGGDEVSWDDITDKPVVIAAGADAGEARDAIGAGTSNLVIGTTADTAKAGNYAPTWAEVTGKPTTFPPVVGTGANDAMPGNTVIPPALTPGVAVADAADETEVVAQFNALLASLRTAGLIET